MLAQGELNRALTVRRWAVVSARLGFLLLLCTLAGGSLAVPKTALAGSVSGVVVAPSPAVPGEPATYTIGFVSTSGLPAGTGTITVDASSGAPGTQFPEALGDYQLSDTTTGGVVKLAAVGAAGQQVTITVGTAVAAGDSLSLVVSDVTNPAVVSTDETLQVSTSSDTAQAASRPYSIVVGSLAVDHSSVFAGAPTTLTFTFTAATEIAGTFALTVPSGWTAPATTAGPGYTTTSLGSVRCHAQQVIVTGVKLASGDHLTIVYGAGGGTKSAVAPVALGSTPFTLSASTPSAIRLVRPIAIGTVSVDVKGVPDGVGAITVTPASVQAGAHEMLTFTYTAPGSGIAGGRLVVSVPSRWSPPSGYPGTAALHDGISRPGHTVARADGRQRSHARSRRRRDDHLR